MPAARSALTLAAALLLALAALLPAPLAAQAFPPLSGRVVDGANILPPEVETRLDGKLAALEKQSRRQLVVVTLPSLEGYEISDYGYRLGRHWGLGDKTRNDGALLIVAPTERKLRIEVGYGLEGILTDGLSSLIINQQIVPRFREGDMPGGIETGVDAIVRHLTLPDEEARALAAQAANAPAQDDGIPVSVIIFAILVFIFVVLPILRGARGGRRRSFGGGPPVIVWGPGTGGFGGGGFGGGGFGGGGFSGGGGSFGGGGASGSW